MANVKCPECGSVVPAGKFCPECGCLLLNPIETEEPVKQSEPPLSISDMTMPSIPNTTASDAGLKMLVDCLKRTVATIGGDGYSEHVLYERNEGEYELHFYSRYAYQPQETHLAYKASKELVIEVYDYLNETKIDELPRTAGGMCGGDFVVKYLMDDKVHFVSLSEIDFKEAHLLYKVLNIISSCMNDDNRID